MTDGWTDKWNNNTISRVAFATDNSVENDGPSFRSKLFNGKGRTESHKLSYSSRNATWLENCVGCNKILS